MKTKMNLLCVLMLTLMVVSPIVGIIMGVKDATEINNNGFTIGPESNIYVLGIGFVAGLVGLGFGIALIVNFVKFILNVNRNKVFTWKNVSLLRWYGISMLVTVACTPIMVFAFNMNIGNDWTYLFENIFEALFALIVAEVFCIGIKLQEEQNLTI